MGPALQAGDDFVEVSETPIGAAPLLAAVAHPRSGATCLFLGTVREYSPGREGVTHLEYEAYSETIEEKLGELVAEARRKWPVCRAALAHRLGRVPVGEISVGVAVSAPHRDEAFAAARFLIDEVKTKAPIWKKECWPGGAEWITERPAGR
jgi:molybdopterin synthase catalytic subunit